MERINERYKYPISPLADSAAEIRGDKYRFTILTSRLIRIEYNENGHFEDRATQTVVNRRFDVPEFKVYQDDEKLHILTDNISITYYTGRKFTQNSLSAKFRGKNNDSWNTWYFGTDNSEVIGGTARTLDNVNGEIELRDGLMSKRRIIQFDDSKSLILSEDGWIDCREDQCVDLYLFAYADDYYGLLKDFYKLSGSTPLLPRYALGNMWSRYYKYRQQEYIDLMDRFKKEGYPFSTAVIDMDWHLVEYDLKYGTGWTGYTWNTKLFPDYKKFLDDLHQRNLEVTLNLHPAGGIVPYEEKYPQMAEAMGVTDGETVEFDIANPKFIEKYFEILHHPYEKDGVTFWWIDWQQGNTTKVENLDPLWMLNHYHFIDMKNSGKRPLILSRYSGVGSHRYPIGFSGDTVVSWESLDFQPYFTASASNVGYTWWSHDIGGHMGGIRDDELNARWVQFGVFSPINRLHSSCHELIGKEPWNYDEMTEKSMKKFLQLRHELIPYLYTMNYRTHKLGEPLIAPLYYKNSDCETAYMSKYRNEYYFGTEMLVSPITQKSDSVTRMGCADTYLPEGMWYDFFNYRRYTGTKELKLYRNIYEMPVLVKAGGIIPLAADGVKNDVSNPEKLLIKVFAGADNSFNLYEDDGVSMEYENGLYAETKFEYKHGKKPEFIIHAPKGDDSVIPVNRNYEIEIIGLTKCSSFTVTAGGVHIECNFKYIDDVLHIYVSSNDEIKIRFDDDVQLKANDERNNIMEFIRRFQGEFCLKKKLYELVSSGSTILKIIKMLYDENAEKNLKDALLEMLIAEQDL